MPRQKREKNGTGICHVMQGKESKTCPYDSLLDCYDTLHAESIDGVVWNVHGVFLFFILYFNQRYRRGKS